MVGNRFSMTYKNQDEGWVGTASCQSIFSNVPLVIFYLYLNIFISKQSLFFFYNKVLSLEERKKDSEMIQQSLSCRRG